MWTLKMVLDFEKIVFFYNEHFGFRFRLLFHGSENLLYMNGSFICGLSMFTYQYNILKPYCVPFPNKSAGEIIIDTYDDNDCDKSFFFGYFCLIIITCHYIQYRSCSIIYLRYSRYKCYENRRKFPCLNLSSLVMTFPFTIIGFEQNKPLPLHSMLFYRLFAPNAHLTDSVSLVQLRNYEILLL